LVLSILADAVEPVSPNLIADGLIISRASVTSLLDSLEKRSHIRRQPHHSDRRRLLMELTPARRKVADQYRQVVHHQQKEWPNGLTDAQQAQLIQMLHKVQASLTDSEPYGTRWSSWDRATR
jgi:DNA-binding MarR family transcriptional regulator